MRNRRDQGDDGAILKERAQALARRPAPPSQAATVQLLEFTVGQVTYAVEGRHVAEAVPLRDLAPVPCAPPFIAGAINVRGHIAAVLDLRLLLELPTRGLVDMHHVVLLRCADLEFGLAAGAVRGMHEHALDDLRADMAPSLGRAAALVASVSSSGVVLLDLPRIAADPRLQAHERPAATPRLPIHRLVTRT